MSTTGPQGLSQDAIEILAAYAVAFPERPARSKLVSWLNHSRRQRGLRGIKPEDARSEIDELVAKGLLAPSVEARRGVAAKGPSALPGTITSSCEKAVDLQLAQAIIEGLQSTLGYSYFDNNLVHGQRLRVEVLSGRFDNLERFDLSEADWLWLVEPRAKPWLESLPPVIQQQACTVCLNFLIETFRPIDVFIQTCGDCAPELYKLLPLMSLGRILRGQFDEARACFSRVPVADQSSKTVIVGALASDALIATLQGDDALALAKINACIEAEKSGTRKRKVYPEYTAFSLALLSLFRSPTPDGGVLLRSLRSMTKTSQLADKFNWLMNLAECAQTPATGYRPLQFYGQEVNTLLMAIASRWHTDYQSVDGQVDYANAQQLFDRAESAGYHWVAAEALTVLEAVGMGGDSKSSAGKRSSGKASAGEKASRKVSADKASGDKSSEDKASQDKAQLSASQRHQQLGTQTLTQLVKTLEAWEMSLQTLESLVPKQTAAKKTTTSKPASRSRLVWQLRTYSFNDADVIPLEQRLDKHGKWSAGRAVALKRLHSKAGEMEFLTDQDKSAASAIDSWNVGWGSSAREYEVGPRAVYKLAGHPHVFNESGEKVDVVECAARLVIDTQPDHLQLKMEPAPVGTNNYWMVVTQNDTRIEVTHYTAAQMRIGDVIEQGGIKVPLAAKQRLLDLASTLATEIPVQSDSQDSASEQHQGDPNPLLQLDYSGDTLAVRIQVEPLPGSEQFFASGEGGEVVYVNSDQGTLQVVRDLARERELMQALIASSQNLSQLYDGRPLMQLTGSELVLELIDELQQLDIRCLWPRDIPIKVTARADSSKLNLSIKSAKDWFSASGSLQYSTDDSLSLSNLLQMIGDSPQSRFLQLARGEFLALSATLRSQLQALQTYGSAQSARDGEQRLHSLSMLALEPLLDSAEITADKHWRNWRERLQQASTLDAELPVTLQADLRPYQLEGYQWLTRIAELGAGACLADDMGLGKTLQTLALLLQRAPKGAALVVAPTSVTGNWLQEAQRFAPTLNARLYGGSAQERKQLLSALQPFDVLIVSYGLLHNDIDTISEPQWHTAVLDEAQVIKNSATQRARAARKLNADFRLATTGTPIQNNLMDLHSLFAFLIPGFLGSVAKFRNTFALPIERDNNENARQQLRSLVAPFMLRRHKRDVLKDLPARTDITLSVELSGEEAALYEALRQQALNAVADSADDAADGSKKLRVLAELTRLRRLCCNPQLIQSDWSGPMAKLALFASTIEELLANKHKVLVFSQFVDHLKILQNHLQQQDISYQYLDGSTTAKQRTERVTAFQSGQGDVFLISLTAGGTGLNLTAADYVIHMDPWWNPAVEDQASDRAHRIGQQRPVTIYRMVTAGTIEAQIQELHATKRELADSLLTDTDSAKFDLGELLKMLQTPALAEG